MYIHNKQNIQHMYARHNLYTDIFMQGYMQICNIPSYIHVCSSAVMKNGIHTSTAKARVVKERDHTHVEERDAVSPEDIHRIDHFRQVRGSQTQHM